MRRGVRRRRCERVGRRRTHRRQDNRFLRRGCLLRPRRPGLRGPRLRGPRLRRSGLSRPRLGRPGLRGASDLRLRRRRRRRSGARLCRRGRRRRGRRDDRRRSVARSGRRARRAAAAAARLRLRRRLLLGGGGCRVGFRQVGALRRGRSRPAEQGERGEESKRNSPMRRQRDQSRTRAESWLEPSVRPAPAQRLRGDGARGSRWRPRRGRRRASGPR
jgi:hypothetical protein